MIVCGDGVASTVNVGIKLEPTLPIIVWTIPENTINAIEHNASEYFSRLELSGSGVLIEHLSRMKHQRFTRDPFPPVLT